MDLVYNLEDDRVHGEIDEETGEMTFYIDGGPGGSRIVNFCPMCGAKLKHRPQRGDLL